MSHPQDPYRPQPEWEDPGYAGPGRPPVQPPGGGYQPNPAPYPTPQPYASYPAPQPYASYPAPQPYASYPAPQPYASYPTPQPNGAYPPPQPNGGYPASQPYGGYAAAAGSYPSQPYGYAGYGYPAPYNPKAGTTNGFAIAGFVLSLLGGWLLGVVFAIVALVQIPKNQQNGKGLAIAALVITGAWIVIGFVAGFIPTFVDGFSQGYAT